MNWLSYGGGVNSTALAVLLASGRVADAGDWTPIFADTGNERDETYAYLEIIGPWFRSIGRPLVQVRPPETVLERWQRLKVTGSRRIRSCTDEAKVKPMTAYIQAHGGGVEFIGIDAGEDHRARPREGRALRWPLVELGLDRGGCMAVIEAAGLPVPRKSGCWHCPHARVSEVMELAREQPARFAVIEALEGEATRTHGPDPRGIPRTQWGDRPASYWRERALDGGATSDLPLFSSEPPCGCYEG